MGALTVAFSLSPLAPAMAQEHQGGSGGHSGASGGHSGGAGGGCGGDEGGCGGGETDSHEGGHSGGGAHGGGIENKVFRGGGVSGHRGGAASGGVEEKIFHGGPGAQGGSGSARSGRPVWAGGAVPETVELGRLNVGRSPPQVLARALNEAYSTNLDKDHNGALDTDADPQAIESPMANLALYAEALRGKREVAGTWTLDQAATFLGKAADKNIPITVDTVRAMGVILQLPVPSGLSAFSYDRAAEHPAMLGSAFGGTEYKGTGIDAFAQAADDARAIASYEHDHPQ